MIRECLYFKPITFCSSKTGTDTMSIIPLIWKLIPPTWKLIPPGTRRIVTVKQEILGLMQTTKLMNAGFTGTWPTFWPMYLTYYAVFAVFCDIFGIC